MRAVKFANVRFETLKSASSRTFGVEWNDAAHITATASLWSAFIEQGALACAIVTLMDLIFDAPRFPGEGIDVGQYPAPQALEDPGSYRSAANQWQHRAASRSIQIGIRFDEALRAFQRDRRAADRDACAVLLHSRRAFLDSVSSLIEAGVSPDGYDPRTPLGRVAVDAWAHIEQAMPDLVSRRAYLWGDLDGEGGLSSELSQNVRNALGRVFGFRDRYTLVHHGFYFFTPAQWAFFKMLDATGFVDQVFVIHDDGKTPVFECWRRFFNPKWGMPDIEEYRMQGEPSVAAKAFMAAWNGQFVDADALVDRLEVHEYRNPAEFVRGLGFGVSLSKAEGSETPKVFAPDHATMCRYAERLSPNPMKFGTNLAQLPVGAFLLRLHDCIRPSDEGSFELRLSEEAWLDMVDSGFLEIEEISDKVRNARSAVRRALPYFDGCESIDDWTSRGDKLLKALEEHVQPLGLRDDTFSDKRRIEVASANYLRLVPWVDLTRHEAQYVSTSLHRIKTLLSSLAQGEKIRLTDHAKFLREKIERGMRDLDEGVRKEIEDKLEGYTIGLKGEIDVTGLIDVVQLLLGREARFDEERDLDRAVDPLRSIDRLGFVPSEVPIHIANLADGSFPSYVPAIGWPFTIDEIVECREEARELMIARSENAQLADLYLLWLALDGTARQKITFSWISEVAGDFYNPSAVLSMLLVPEARGWEAVRRKAGGIPPETSENSVTVDVLYPRPQAAPPEELESAVSAALRRLPLHVQATAYICPRRLAFQWVLGDSHSFQSPHLQSTLYGNMIGAVERRAKVSLDRARSACNLLFRQLSGAERRSSFEFRRIQGSGKASADPVWIFFLKGAKNKPDRFSIAYDIARGEPARSTGPELGAGFLPDMNDATDDARQIDAGMCERCPVQRRCAQAKNID